MRRVVFTGLFLALVNGAWAHGAAAADADVPRRLAAPPKRVTPLHATDLRFAEMYRMPVGPRGLEPTDKLQSLDGKPVRLIGYMAAAEEAVPGLLVLSPLPVTLGDADERLVDDLPPTAVFVHLSPRYAGRTVPNLRGLVALTGTLQLGGREEADGHLSHARLQLDDTASALLVKAAPAPQRQRAQGGAHPHDVAAR